VAFHLDRFLEAQATVFPAVVAELRAGRKTTHWMWFVFPQLRGLGRSEMASFYGLDGLAEAKAYLGHPVLGPRLSECTAIVNALGPGATAITIFGMPDALKFQSCMTLFELVDGPQSEFSRALDRHFDGERDAKTLALASGHPEG
jgi:uncharacterized protein (DUF1810 family)